MRIVKMSSPLRVVAILLALLGSAVVHAIPVPADVEPLEPSDRHGKVSRLVPTLFERSHYNRAPGRRTAPSWTGSGASGGRTTR